MREFPAPKHRLLSRHWGDPEPMTPRRLMSLYRRGLPPAMIAGRFRLDRARVAGLLGYYGLEGAGAAFAEKRR